MKYLLVSLYGVLLFFLSFQVQALDYMETLKATIVKVSPNHQRIILNRGREDGIQLEDTANFMVEEKFLFRGVAVVVNLEYSEWYVQRGEKKALTENTAVELISLFGQQRPRVKNMAEIQSASFMRKLKEEYYSKNKRDIEEKKREQEKILKKQYALERYKRFHIPNHLIQFDLSPVAFSSPREERFIGLGIQSSNVDQSEMITHQRFRITDSQYHNRFSQQKLKRNEQLIGLDGEIIHFYQESWNSFHDFQFKKISEDGISPIHHQALIGFMGIKKYWKLHYRLPRLTFTYIPQLEFFSGDQRGTSLNGPSSRQQQTLFRHSFRGNVLLQWNEQWEMEESLQLSPRLYFNRWPVALNEMPWEHLLKISYALSPSSKVSMENQYTYDARFKALQVEGGEWKNTLFFHYKFEIQDLFL
jgi:hypothetical protein